jgi:hypothetical protein
MVSAQKKSQAGIDPNVIKGKTSDDQLHGKFTMRLLVHNNVQIKINGEQRALVNTGDTVKMYFKKGKEMPDTIIAYSCNSRKNILVYPVQPSDLNVNCSMDMDFIGQAESNGKIDNAVYSLAASSIFSMDNDMVLVKGGTFLMGIRDTADVEGGEDEKPGHKVTLNSFYISKYEVSQALWIAVMDTNPSIHKDCYLCPVENVSWNDVQRFIDKLNKMTKHHYRLPTEAEWEYAAKGGAQSKGFIYSGSNDINEVAWYYTVTGSHPVGLKKANELGLFDMTGNINEWCSDWYGLYTIGTAINPTGPKDGNMKTLRGGNWLLRDEGSIVTMRFSLPVWYHDQFVGLRLVRDKD